ncbi:cell adhesion molecule Dscam1-like [Centruroides vittatus]|uniref:cell adhesion molecule Dscam1-like n=1 Tax=Centruroides vittatus TaxID=120091 RepID=UPI0035109458
MQQLMESAINVVLHIFVFYVSECLAKNQQGRALAFSVEPSQNIDFYNTTGTVIPCSAHGEPAPTLTWKSRDGSVVTDVPDLRHVRPDGSLVFNQFQPEQYRQDVHATVYYCVASNVFGSIASRDVHVRGIVKQPYKIQVFDEFTIYGNTAVLKCSIPSFVRDYVMVTSWIRDDSINVISSAERGGKYSVFPTGELHIRGVSVEDGFKTYRCVTRNRITGEIQPSSSAGKLIVTDSHSSVSPRITHSKSKIQVDKGQTVELPCAAQGYPVPTYTWYRVNDNYSRPPSRVQLSGRITQLDGTLIVRQTNLNDNGKYICAVNNSNGQEKVETELLVRETLTVHVDPPYQTVDVGKSATFVCNVSGHPIHAINWKKDLQPVLNAGRSIVTRDTLRISTVEREDRGMYQCFVYNDKESAQGTSQLILGDVTPMLKQTFESETIEPGSPMSLKCIAAGNPLPQVTWTLDDVAIPDHVRFSVGDFVTRQAEVISFVNVTSARVEDGGYYKCQAANDIGKISHTAKINVIGPPYVRVMKDVVAVEGDWLWIRCPVAGYPIEEIYWEHNGRRIPYNHRQKTYKNGTLTVRDVDRRSDGGKYTCVARNTLGQRGERNLNVRVLSPPVIEPFAFPEAVEEGSRSKVLCSVTKGDPPITIQWLKEGKPLPHDLGVTETILDEFSKALIFPRVDLRHRGNYTCTAVNSAATATLTASMIVHAPPRWTLEPTNTAAVLGTDVLLNCKANGFPKPQIIWKRAEGSLTSDYKTLLTDAHIHMMSNGSLSVRHVEKSDSGYYMCQASNGIGSGISTVVKLTVRVPAYFKEEFKAETIRKGENIRIKCQAFGDRPLSVTWRKDSQVLDRQLNRKYMVEDTLTDDGMTSELNIPSADRRDSSLFTCTAANTYGKDDLNIQIIVQERPDKPLKVSVAETESRHVIISWSPPFSGNSPIQQYIVQYKTDKENWSSGVKQTTAAGMETKATISSLNPASTYHIRLFAENSFGRSDPSNTITVTTNMEVPGGPPLNIRAEAVSSQTLRVFWQPPQTHLRHGQLKGYYVGYRVHGSGDPYTYKTLEITDKFKNECTINHLNRLTKYSIIVQAFNSIGAGPPSDQIIVQTKDNDPPLSPKISIVSSTHSSIQIKWDVKKDSSNPITGFVLQHKRELGAWKENKLSGKERSYNFQGLHCGTRYHFLITAYNEVGEGIPSDVVKAKTQGVVPIAPTQSDFLRVNTTFAALRMNEWINGGCPINFFVIQCKPETDHEWNLVSDHITPEDDVFYLEGLSPGTWYRVHVTAHNEVGSTEAEFTFNTLHYMDGTPLMPIVESFAPFYTNLAIMAPVIVTFLIIISVCVAICILNRRRRQADHQYQEPRNIRKDVVSEVMQMSDFESKQTEGSYVHKEPLYFPSPYATSRIAVFNREDRSSGDSSTDGRSISLHDGERAYDVPFAVKQSNNISSHQKSGRDSSLQLEVDHMYSFPGRTTYQSISSSTTKDLSSRRWSSDVDDEFPSSNMSRCRIPSNTRWHCSTKQGGPNAKPSGEGYHKMDHGRYSYRDTYRTSQLAVVVENSDTECDQDQLLDFERDSSLHFQDRLPYHIAVGQQVMFKVDDKEYRVEGENR